MSVDSLIKMERLDHVAAFLGVELHTYPTWPVASLLDDPEEGFVSVNIGDTSWLFSLFYGRERTIKAYIRHQRSFPGREVKILEKTRTRVGSTRATSLALYAEESIGAALYYDELGQIEEHEPRVEATYSHYLFAKHLGRRLQIGYKLEVPLLDLYQPLVEEMLSRIRFVEPQRLAEG